MHQWEEVQRNAIQVVAGSQQLRKKSVRNTGKARAVARLRIRHKPEPAELPRTCPFRGTYFSDE